ncbi:MAG: GTPase HflX [candidate division Zixibacteria bacterium]|nr:GTPase HflX [candidate division Zixibacteria bacterium]
MYQIQKLRWQEKAVLVGVKLPQINRFVAEDSLAELSLLAKTAGAEVLESIIQEKKKIDAGLFIGKGKVEQIKQLCLDREANLVIFDDDLSPGQIFNLEKILDLKVIDRSCLVLDIFAKRARTTEAKIQVELAQLQYLLPRLTRGWLHLSRQWGGIGTKGPGETQLEVDRRVIKKKIGDLKGKLVKIDKERQTQRKKREDFFKVALVGYTNAGKSTLFNQLTKATVPVEEKLFTTLDSFTRILRFSKKHDILLTDTVGFIRKLPHHLIASFRSTLDEVKLADLLLHIVDISHPNFSQQIEKVSQTLEELSCSTKPTLLVFNKIDKLKGELPLGLCSSYEVEPIFISAEKGIGLTNLITNIELFMDGQSCEAEIFLKKEDMNLLPSFYKLGIVTETEMKDEGLNLKIRAKKWNLEKLKSLANGEDFA